jgi:hypothetical protein
MTTGTPEETIQRSEQLAKLLEFEIQRIQTESDRPGWTRWALLVSLSTCAWLALAEAKSETVDFSKALFLALALHLTYDLVILLSKLLTPRETGSGLTRFEKSNSLLGHGRLYFVTNVFRYGGLAAIAFFNPVIPSGWLTSTVYATVVLQSFVFVVLVGLSFLGLPVAQTFPNIRGTGAIFLILVAVFATAVGHLWSTLLMTFTLAEVATMRLSGLLVVSAVLVSLLARERIRPPLLTTLLDIRRELALSNLEYETARKQTEIALKGMTVSDMYQEHGKRVLESLREAITHEETIRSQLRTLRSSLDDKVPSQYGEKEQTITAAILESVEAYSKKTTSALDRAFKEYEVLLRRIMYVTRVAPRDVEEFREGLQNLVAQERKTIAELSSEIKEEFRVLKSLVGE